MYKYEMHCHTAQTSRCGHIDAADLIDFYKAAGYTGVVVTDHFFNGNCAVPRALPWKTRVELFQKGYKAAKERGDEIGVDVFFGWEFTYVDGTDFLTYGLGADWLLEHKDCDKMRIVDYCTLVQKSGGYVVHAHPFREDSYIEMIRLLPRNVDAVETLNAGRKDFENKMADQYADNYGLPKMCGTDNHTGMRDRLAVLELDFRAENSAEIIKAVLEGRHKMSLVRPEQDGEKIKLIEL